MKTLVAVALTALALAGCSEPTGLASSLAPSYAKEAPPVVVVTGSLLNTTFNFDDGIFTSADGPTFNMDDLDTGGTASPPLIAAVHEAPFSDQFLGRVHNNRIRMIVPDGGSLFSLSYDLYIIGSWDGMGKQSGKQYGEDVWSNSIACTATGEPVLTLLTTTFSNQKTVQQSYPKSYPEGGYKAGTGAFAVNTLGFMDDPTSHTPSFTSYSDTWYKMSFSGANPCGAGNPMYVLWSAPNASLQSDYDESWGLDNVHILIDQ